MKPLSLTDIVPNQEYEKIRPEMRAKIIALKKRRRVAVGPRISVVFENTETMRFQVQEMMRIEHIEKREAILQELDVYNDLLPAGSAIGATLLIELTQEDDLAAVLKQLSGVEEEVYLEMGPRSLRAEAEEGRSTEEKTSSVHYLTFRFSPEDRQALADNAHWAALAIRHPQYQYRVTLAPETVASLVSDLI